jgi:RNA-binding protein
MKKEKLYLKGKQARFLRGLGHHLSPLAMIGKEGITDNLVGSINAILTAHELVKIKMQENSPVERVAAAESIAGQTGSRIAQIIGKTFLLYRENKKIKDDQKIILPKA